LWKLAETWLPGGVPQIPLEASKEMLQRALDLLQQMSTHSVCCYIHLAEMWLNQ